MAEPPLLWSRVEDAGLNASAPPQQRWIDGWLVRTSPGKAKRARCVNAVAPGRLPLDDKLRLAGQAFAEATLPMVVRITPFTVPCTLDAELAARGFTTMDDTRVMVREGLPPAVPTALPAGLRFDELDPADFAEAVGALRSSSASQRDAHAARLRHSPVRCRAQVIRRESDASVLACGQFTREADVVGLYDVHTLEAARGQGLASAMCARLLALAALEGARSGYLQVDADNATARHIYRRLGFADAYAYHYRVAP